MGIEFCSRRKMAFAKTPSTFSSTTASEYRDRYFQGSDDDYHKRLAESCTLYIGNMSFYTSEDQIYELFGMCGEVKRVIMGLDRNERTPCGFCFVEYYTRNDAEKAVVCINGTKLDDRVIRVDWDAGFIEGRQYGRGKSGGQVRDEFRDDYDEDRGGLGSKSRDRMDRGMDYSRRKRYYN